MTIAAPTPPSAPSSRPDTWAWWRRRAEAVGVDCAFGTPQPPGRRIRVLVRDGRVVGDRDETARWRGRILLSESPALLTADERLVLHDLAGRLEQGFAALEFASDAEGWLFLGGQAATDAPVGSGVQITATIATWAPYRGPVTDIEVPDGTTPLVERGQHLDCSAGTPLLCITATTATRDAALALLQQNLDTVRIGGPVTDLARLNTVLPRIATGLRGIRDLDDLDVAPAAIAVLAPGLATSVQDWPGRLGHWDVGVPPSGPYDDLAFRLANRQVGNLPHTPGLEITLSGPTLRFLQPSIICLAGPPRRATLDGHPLPMWRVVHIPARAVLDLGPRPSAAAARTWRCATGWRSPATSAAAQSSNSVTSAATHAAVSRPATCCRSGESLCRTRWPPAHRSCRSPPGRTIRATGASGWWSARSRRPTSSPPPTPSNSTPTPGRCSPTATGPACG